MISIEPKRGLQELNRKHGWNHVGSNKSKPFVESLAGEYTHRVRHVTLVQTVWGITHLAVRCWCGMSLMISPKNKSRLVDEPGEGRPMCATCEGKAIGAGLTESREINGKAVMFRPRKGARND